MPFPFFLFLLLSPWYVVKRRYLYISVFEMRKCLKSTHSSYALRGNALNRWGNFITGSIYWLPAAVSNAGGRPAGRPCHKNSWHRADLHANLACRSRDIPFLPQLTPLSASSLFLLVLNHTSLEPVYIFTLLVTPLSNKDITVTQHVSVTCLAHNSLLLLPLVSRLKVFSRTFCSRTPFGFEK